MTDLCTSPARPRPVTRWSIVYVAIGLTVGYLAFGTYALPTGLVSDSSEIAPALPHEDWHGNVKRSHTPQ